MLDAISYVKLFLNTELVSRAKLCLVSVFPDIVTDCPKMIFRRFSKDVSKNVCAQELKSRPDLFPGWMA